MSREAGLFQALTATDRLSDLLPVLHHHAVSASDGRSSILFQFNRGEADPLRATSAFGVDRLPTDPWPARTIPEILFRNKQPLFIEDISNLLPKGSDCVGTPSAILVPLMHIHEPLGVLVVGCATVPSTEQLTETAAVGHAFVVALVWARAASESDLQRELKELLQAFSRDVSNATLSAGLDTFCLGVNRLFGADRTSVWLHDRRARMMVLSASSDVAYFVQQRRVPTTDSLSPAARGLRRERAEMAFTGSSGTDIAMVTVPLKGKRRALGTPSASSSRASPMSSTIRCRVYSAISS